MAKHGIYILKGKTLIRVMAHLGDRTPYMQEYNPSQLDRARAEAERIRPMYPNLKVIEREFDRE